MIKELRHQFNENFKQDHYREFVQEVGNLHPGQMDFRVAETPVFIPKSFKHKMLDTCEEIIDLILDPRFKSLTDNAIPKNCNVPYENSHPHFIVFDFGICENDDHQIEPQLVEMQGFPSLFAFKVFYDAIAKKYAHAPAGFDSYLNDYNESTYVQLLKDIIVGKTNPENVILLEIFPEKQKTRLDFYCTEDLLGIRTVCLTKLITQGNKLYYEHNNRNIEIKKIYNRIISDELRQQNDLKNLIDLSHPWEVEWITHPNWFYRISKYTLPFIHHPHVPETFFVNEIKQLPGDLENYVLKPLFSFAGSGVVIDALILLSL